MHLPRWSVSLNSGAPNLEAHKINASVSARYGVLTVNVNEVKLRAPHAVEVNSQRKNNRW